MEGGVEGAWAAQAEAPRPPRDHVLARRGLRPRPGGTQLGGQGQWGGRLAVAPRQPGCSRARGGWPASGLAGVRARLRQRARALLDRPLVLLDGEHVHVVVAPARHAERACEVSTCIGVRRGGGGGGGGQGGEDGEKAGMGAVRPAACLPLQCPPNIMMLSCDASDGGRLAEGEQRVGRVGAARAAGRRGG